MPGFCNDADDEDEDGRALMVLTVCLLMMLADAFTTEDVADGIDVDAELDVEADEDDEESAETQRRT